MKTDGWNLTPRLSEEAVSCSPPEKLQLGTQPHT